MIIDKFSDEAYPLNITILKKGQGDVATKSYKSRQWFSTHLKALRERR
jgi:hypothetical protein